MTESPSVVIAQPKGCAIRKLGKFTVMSHATILKLKVSKTGHARHFFH